MIGRIVALLSAIFGVIQHVLRERERRITAEEAARQRALDEEKAHGETAISEDPSEWFIGHFDGNASSGDAGGVPPTVPDVSAGACAPGEACARDPADG